MTSVSARSGLWFIAVGAAASATHVLVFTLLQRAVWPELSNAAGFLVAFFVSFFGHRFLSFAGTKTSTQTSLLRFGVAAVAGFATNEAIFVLLYRVLGWPSVVALIVGMVAAAGQTFLLSRYWAFKP